MSIHPRHDAVNVVLDVLFDDFLTVLIVDDKNRFGRLVSYFVCEVLNVKLFHIVILP